MSGEQLNTYLSQLLPEEEQGIKEIRDQATIDGVPIMHLDAMNVVVQYVKLIRAEKILEIGTAVGYSAIKMAKAHSDAHVFTIERDTSMQQTAQINLRRMGLNERINIIEGDALELVEQLSPLAPFDVLVIDAAKGQYQRFLDLYAPLVKDGGLIICDNILFRGYVYGSGTEVPKRFKKLTEKLRRFNEQLAAHPDFQTTVLPIGDGLSISIKKA